MSDDCSLLVSAMSTHAQGAMCPASMDVWQGKRTHDSGGAAKAKVAAKQIHAGVRWPLSTNLSSCLV